jgi:hypothetical protein
MAMTAVACSLLLLAQFSDVVSSGAVTLTISIGGNKKNPFRKSINKVSSEPGIQQALWKKELEDHYKRHRLIVKYIQDGKEPNAEFLVQVLCFNKPSKITKDHLILCADIYDKRITMPLPMPNTEHVSPFTKLAGTEH